jgi:hypothetical protein
MLDHHSRDGSELHNAQVDYYLRLVLLVLWLAAGALIGRKSGRQGTGMLWALMLGPLGVAFFAFGEWRRSEQGQEPSHSDAPAALDLPVQVSVDGQWVEGRLDSWTTRNTLWQGWVRYSIHGQDQSEWFDSERVRRAGASPW